jgi:hypothetical protein
MESRLHQLDALLKLNAQSTATQSIKNWTPFLKDHYDGLVELLSSSQGDLHSDYESDDDVSLHDDDIESRMTVWKRRSPRDRHAFVSALIKILDRMQIDEDVRSSKGGYTKTPIRDSSLRDTDLSDITKERMDAFLRASAAFASSSTFSKYNPTA